MTIETYDDLKAAVADFSGSNSIASFLDTAIQIADSRLYANDSETLKIRSMETLTTSVLSTSSRFLALPTGFLSMRKIGLIYSDQRIALIPVMPDSLKVYDVAGIPKFYTVTSQIELDRTPDDTYSVEIQHFAKLPALSDSVDDNALLLSNPDVYLYGALWVVNQRAGEQDIANFYKGEFYAGIAGVNARDKEGALSPAPRKRMMGGVI